MVEDYAIHHRRGGSVGTGIYYQSRNGKQKEATEYREIYETDAGNFLPQEWHDRILQAIEEAGETPLLERIKEYCRQHCPWLHKERDIEDYAAECLASRAYQYWKDFAGKEGDIFFIG